MHATLAEKENTIARLKLQCSEAAGKAQWLEGHMSELETENATLKRDLRVSKAEVEEVRAVTAGTPIFMDADATTAVVPVDGGSVCVRKTW